VIQVKLVVPFKVQVESHNEVLGIMSLVVSSGPSIFVRCFEDCSSWHLRFWQCFKRPKDGS
jgi:hypothetical protein